MDMDVVLHKPLAYNSSEITAAKIRYLSEYIIQSEITILSLDCFDTLIWRYTASPDQIFAIMEQDPKCKKLGFTAYKRLKARDRACRHQYLKDCNYETSLEKIYSHFKELTLKEQQQLCAIELATEIAHTFAFEPFIDLIRRLKNHDIRIIITSNIYLSAAELAQILRAHCPADILEILKNNDTNEMEIFCSSDFNCAKSSGLFQKIIKHYDINPARILHIGDNKIEDFVSAKKAKLEALHFLQTPTAIQELLNLDKITAKLKILTEPKPSVHDLPHYNPFLPIFAMHNVKSAEITPTKLIGYYSFGPILYGFAQFVNNTIKQIKKTKPNVKVLFLLRDAHLLYSACRAYNNGEDLGQEIRIRKFGAQASSFHSLADIDNYLLSLGPKHYNFWVICEQLLLPQELKHNIINQALNDPNPERSFNAQIRSDKIVNYVIEASQKYRERFKKYLVKNAAIQQGDTLVLVDTGYMGVTQDSLIKALKSELDIDILGCYLVATPAPHRPPCYAFLNSSECDHGLFEQVCTYKEPAVIDYDYLGDPIFETLKLKNEQYEKLQGIQDEAIQFIYDANKYYSKHPNNVNTFINNAAINALKRHVYFPLAQELEYFKNFQHDKDLGPNLDKTMYNTTNSILELQKGSQLQELHPFEVRAENIQYSIAALVQKCYNISFTEESLSLRTIAFKLQYSDSNDIITVNAKHTYNDYYLLKIDLPCNKAVRIFLPGKIIQLQSITRLSNLHLPANTNVTLENIATKYGTLFEILSDGNSSLNIGESSRDEIYAILIRPII
jgi:phosphoglycolate phosphatase-like HAD superfamily hydrolase